MKCPKCGYLGFETTDRCRNCGYDFSLVASAPSAELPMRTPEGLEAFADLELRGADAHGPSDAGSLPLVKAPAGVDPVELASSIAERVPAFPSDPAPARTARTDELPLFAPRPAGNPLAVRRATTELPKTRRTTGRIARVEALVLPLIPETVEPSGAESAHAPLLTRTSETAVASMVARVGAAVLDLLILGAIFAAVLFLTLRIANLDPTVESLALIRPIPMAAFLVLLGFLYVVGFTLGGGQTIGKMAARIRVIGDDGQGVDAAGAIVRGAGCVLSILTFGLLFAVSFVTTDRRAPYDRVAGTRVVKA